MRSALIAAFLVIPSLVSGEGLVPPHQPPVPKEDGAARSWAEKYKERGQWWCFQPVADPAPPVVRDKSWPRGAIDRFILARMEQSDLMPAPRATSQALARRLSFALTGLPPAMGDDALPFDALVEKLLASPRFGEHWARHWMDVVRYAETFGSEHDYWNPGAWRYRDYLVRAFNADLPYDQFVTEQLAGDLLTSPRIVHGVNESLLATAFHRMTEYYATPVDVMREQSAVIDWQLDTVSKAFMGLTIACARCHDHKFDAISTADYYALYGVLVGGRPVQNVIADPATLTAHDAELLTGKQSLRRELATEWSGITITADALRKAIANATKESRLKQLLDDNSPARAAISTPPELALSRWSISGPGLPQREATAGALSLHAQGDLVARSILPAGLQSDAASDRHGGSARSPEFTLTTRNISVLVCGTGKARLRLVVEGCQGDIVLFSPANADLETFAPRWVTLTCREQWLGRRAHIEVMTRDDKPTVGNIKSPLKQLAAQERSSFFIGGVVLHENRGDAPQLALPSALWKEKPANWGRFVANFNAIAREAVRCWKNETLDSEQALLLQAMLDANLLPNQISGNHTLGALTTKQRELDARIPIAARAPGIRDDGAAADMPVFIRGDYTTPGEMVPRRMPTILGGRSLASEKEGRLLLARELTRVDHPLTARVMVNRVWHHLLGRGLVATPDNLGRMGGQPSHPELLDHLATQFVRGGWSVKQLVRDIVTSRIWQQACEPSPEALARDPENLLLSHTGARRLQAEAIRDAMLAIAGNLQSRSGGPSVLGFYPTVIDPDKQPPAGPLDGDGRRSLYLEVRRNFLNDFLLAFDFPRPNLPVGGRNITNVPAQSITLLNDPFVLHQAGVWSRRITQMPGSDEAHVREMYREAFSRDASDVEMRCALDFVKDKPEAWRDLAHAIFNMKEFIYLP